MVRQLEQLQRERQKLHHQQQQRSSSGVSSSVAATGGSDGPIGTAPQPSAGANVEAYECVALHVSPDLGERLMLTGDRALLDEVRIAFFPLFRFSCKHVFLKVGKFDLRNRAWKHCGIVNHHFGAI